MSSAADVSAARLRVTAVIVSHDGAAWLPRLLASLAESTRAPDVTVGVDTGSTDESAALLRDRLDADHVVEVDRRSGFGAAVAAGINATTTAADMTGSRQVVPASRGRHAAPQAAAEDWVWLLHDDCAPAPDALARLLETAVSDPRIAVVGCRMRAWPQARRLLEVGVSITGTGQRVTGLEPGEYDQGQYDEVRDVLAVSTAGMLVRLSVWHTLGGLDPRLPLFRDDVDLGWRAAAAGYRVVVAPDAVVFHVQAASRGLRAIASNPRRPHRADRRAGILTLLSNCRAAALPLVYVRLLVGSVLRALGYLVGKLPSAAWDEVAGAAAALGRPGQLLSARRSRRAQRKQRPASVRRLLPPWWTPYANGLDVVLYRLAETFRRATATLASSSGRLRAGRGDPTRLESGPVAEEAVSLPTGEGPLALVARHPVLALTALLTLAGLVASRGLWGAGFLQGGALPPAPGGARDWWRLFVEVHHPVGLGSDLATAPYVALLALPGAVLLGKAWLVVDVLMLFAPVLAGFGAWLASGRLVRGLGVRLWMSVGYGLLPVVTGAVASGHLGTVAAAVLLPWVARSGCRILDLDAPGRWGDAWATGLTLSLATAFAPACWPIFVVLGVLAMGWLAARRHWMRVAQWLVALVLPVGLLAPWSWRVLTHPTVALTEAGLVDVPGNAASQAGWRLAFLRIAAVGEAPWWLTAGLTVVAVTALLRSDTRGRVAASWLVVAAGFAAAAVMGRHAVSAPLGAGQAYPWLGLPLIVAGAGAIAAAGIAADGLRSYVGSGSFGWRQPLALLAVVAGLTVPVLGVGWWVGAGPAGELHRAVAVPLPAYMVDAMSSEGARVLVLNTGTGTVHYRVLAGDGVRLGDDSVLPAGGSPRLASVVEDVLSQARPEDVPTLARMGIRYVVLPSPQAAAAVVRLDGLAGLSRTSTEQTVLSGWQLSAAADPPSAVMAGGDQRTGLVVSLVVLWVLVALLAAPGIRRRPLPAATGSP
jgi:GT2 family glycosyltransferase